jgi:hypothetical protein
VFNVFFEFYSCRMEEGIYLKCFFHVAVLVPVSFVL